MSDDRTGTSAERIRELRKKIEELKKQFPAHSIPPGLMRRLDELEEELEQELAKSNQE